MQLISFRGLLGLCFVIASLFPWVSFRVTSFETQLWHVLWGGAFALLSIDVRFPREIIFIFLGVLFSVFVIFFDFYFSDLSARAVLSYFSFSITFFAFYLYVKVNGFPLRLFLIANFVWLMAGLIQLFWGVGIFEWVVVSRTSDERGVPALASEPTYFAIYLFFLSWTLLLYSNYKPSLKLSFLIFLNVLFVFFVAKSSMVILFFFVLFLMLMVFYFKLSRLPLYFLFLAGSFLFYIALGLLFPESRIVAISRVLAEDPFSLFFVDASANERLKNIAFPLIGFVDNFFMPGGFNSFESMHENLLSSHGDYFWYGEGGGKILSMTGSIFYELGFFGVIFILVVGVLVFDGTKRSLFELLLLFILSFSAISLAFPLISILLATMFFRKKELNFV